MSRLYSFCLGACLFALLLGASLEASADEGKDKFKWEGFVRSLVDIEVANHGDIWHEGRLAAKSKRKNGFRAELEIEVETQTDSLEVLEALIDRKLDNLWRWEAGFTQKRLGVEYEENRLERLTIERTMLYRRLELFNYVGRENIFRLRKEEANERFNDWSFAAGFSEAENASLIVNRQLELPAWDARYGVWLELGSDKIQDGTQPVFVLMNSLWHRAADHLWQLELAVGLDPQQSEYERIFAEGEKVYFTALNGLWGQRISGDEEESWSLLASSGVFLHDQRQSAYNSLGLLLGVRYKVGDLRLTLTGEAIGTNSPILLKKRSYDDSSAKLEAIYVL